LHGGGGRLGGKAKQLCDQPCNECAPMVHTEDAARVEDAPRGVHAANSRVEFVPIGAKHLLVHQWRLQRWGPGPWHKVSAAVSLPAGLVRFPALRRFLTIGDDLNPVARDPGLVEDLRGALRPVVAEADVVFG